MASSRKQSLFAQRMQNAKKSRLDKQEKEISFSSVDFSCFGNKSNIVEGPDAEVIHQENIQKLNKMTSEDIEKERNQLLASLDPSIVEFIKSRKSAKTLQNSSRQAEVYLPKPNQMDHSGVEGVKQTPAVELVNKFPHMDVIEPEKLKWMEDVPAPKPPASGVPYNARFNFDGELLPYCDERLVDGLHHHGEEPERPGYTLQELMQLSRSSMLQQRITAISSLANIFLKASDYDYCLEKPLLPQLLDSELYLLLRFTLDDPVRSVISAAIAAITNLLVNIKDEGCLDRLLGLSTGLRQPTLYVHLDLKPNELAELKDAELLKVDVIRGVLRTHLLPRFRYILEKLNPEPVEITHILRCLIRISRHSYEASLNVYNAPGLLKVVRQLLDDPPPRACSEALKLFRVMACQSQNMAVSLLDEYSLIEPIQHFIAGNREETSMSLVLESFYIWQTFLVYRLATNHISMFSPVIQRLLITHADSISLDSSGGDLEHATALISWVTSVLRVDFHGGRCFLPALQLCALKWLSQAAQIPAIKWAASKLLEAVFQALAVLITEQESKNLEIQHKVHVFMVSENFEHLSQKLRRSSWLLEGERSPAVVESLPCLGSIPPTLYDDSPLPVILGLAVYLFAIRSSELSERFVSTEGVLKYMEEVVTAGVRTTAHWFARQEIVLIYTLLQIHLNTQTPAESSLLHQAALFLSTAIHSDDRYMLSDLFRQVVFNRRFFCSDTNDVAAELQNLQINSDVSLELNIKRPKLLNEALDSLETICHCYEKELCLEGLASPCPPPTLTASYRGIEPALPADWYFLPIVHLNNIEGNRDDAVNVAVSCLQWSLILECQRPQFVAQLDPAARFCRLACVLLAGNDLFRDVKEWLGEALQALLVHNDEMRFNKPIPGLKSFYDFYRQVLEQFVGVSYGDTVFGQFVLIPLQQRHEIRLRKLVWCELGAVLRFLSTPINQVGIPLKNFLEPCETDPDLLFIYMKALGQGRVRKTFCPVLYHVAVHHVATFTSLYPEQLSAKRLGQMIDTLGNQELKSLLRSYSQSQHTF